MKHWLSESHPNLSHDYSFLNCKLKVVIHQYIAINVINRDLAKQKLLQGIF